MGFFKSIFKGIKKVFKGVAKVVKSIVKPIVKVVKKALKNPIVKGLLIAGAIAYGGYFLVNQSLIGSGTHFLNFMQNPLSTNLFVPTATSKAGTMLAGSNIIAGQGVAGGLMSGTEAMASWEGVNVGGQMLQGGQVVTAGAQVGSVATTPGAGAQGSAVMPPGAVESQGSGLTSGSFEAKLAGKETGLLTTPTPPKPGPFSGISKAISKTGESVMAGDLTGAAEGAVGTVVESGKFVAKGAKGLYEGFKGLPSPVQTAIVQGTMNAFSPDPGSPYYEQAKEYKQRFAEAPPDAQDELTAYWNEPDVQALYV